MPKEIINRVAKNKNLVVIDLEDFYPVGERVVIDIQEWLLEGLVLQEKKFRESVENHDWNRYRDCYISLICSTDAIIPSWAYLLVATKLATISKKVIVGDLSLLETTLFQEIIEKIDVSTYREKSIIVKGCTKKPIPASAYTLLVEKLVPIARKILYGEACSSVLLYKKDSKQTTV